MAKKTKNLEEQLLRLEQIQTVLESGTAPIEEQLKFYEEGMSLVKDARLFLQKAEQRVIEIRADQPLSVEDDDTDVDVEDDDDDDDSN